ncbi:MAG TPA: VWA domain-containing protein [Candidatus Sulfotelmatobacter sp.]|nr:VWA domain-containing protein [Candidatus Sulfotelmatobacter sp.]
MRISGWVFALVAAVAVWTSHTRAQQPSPPPPPAAGQAPAPQSPPAPGDAGGQQKQMPTISVTTGLVHLVATVTDRRHNFITNLDRNEFKITEDGVPQEIKYFGRETDLPLRIGLLLDTSNSIRPRLEFEQDAAIDFLHSVIRRNKDMAFLMTFDNEPEVIQNFTGDIDLLTKAIRKQRAGGGTALHDAIYLAAEKLSSPALPAGPSAEVRRVLVVISDGDDNLSDHAKSDAIDAAIRAEASIYAISTNTEWLSVSSGTPRKLHLEAGDKVLEEFASQSGGRVFFPYRVDDLAQSFVDIGTELRSQYFIAYSPTNPLSNGKYRRIDVETERKGLVVRTRKGYYATASASNPAK